MVIIMSGTIRYTIRPYDTIWMLAQVFNTTVDSIMDLNPGIEPRNLQIGQVITIAPGYQYYPEMTGTPGNIGTSGIPRNNGMPVIPGTIGFPGMPNNNGMSGNGRPAMPGTNGVPATNGMPSNNGMFDNGTFGMPGANVMPGANGMMGMPSDVDVGELCDLTNYMRMLWEQHVTWSIIAIMGILHDLPEKELIIQRLLRNPMDFVNALMSFYGEESAQTFEELFTGHLTIAAELIEAIEAGNTSSITEIEQRWFDNADQIAGFLASINPNWSVDDWSAMLDEHLELLRANIDYMVTKNYEESINTYDDIQSQALEMADMMAEGIYLQFPNQ